MRFDVITLFPDMFDTLREQGVNGRAHQKGIWSLATWNPRDFTHDVHRTVDDRPYGGGPGMVMLAEPLAQAVQAARSARQQAIGQGRAASLQAELPSVPADAAQPCADAVAGTPAAPAGAPPDAPVVLMSPTGRRFDQRAAQMLAEGPGAILVCGRYEGIDQRFIDRYVTDEISLGDFVLSGGEIAAQAIIDSVVRLLPGVLNDGQSALQDSFHDCLTGLLDSPHYTRPETYDDETVPQALLSGHHANIALWRRQQSLALTLRRRPDLIERARRQGLLNKADEAFLATLALPGQSL